MTSQLDILALEPFFGGARRAMLETVIRFSRHRWTVLKLPPRRIERRLTAAANWFAEQLSRHWAGRIDLLFTSEAMNLASLYRLAPSVAKEPSVVYFHDNQLPHEESLSERPLDLVNLNTATAASQIWFNSDYHMHLVQARIAALVGRHPELSSRSPVPGIASKSHLVRPPIDFGLVQQVRSEGGIKRQPRAIFVETRDADVGLLNAALTHLENRKEEFTLITVGPVEELSPRWSRRTISEIDDAGQLAGLAEAGLVVSVRSKATADHQAIRGMVAGCRPVLPDSGVYPEIVPPDLCENCLYRISPVALADNLQDALRETASDTWHPRAMRGSFKLFDAISACKQFDERLEELVVSRLRGV